MKEAKRLHRAGVDCRVSGFDTPCDSFHMCMSDTLPVHPVKICISRSGSIPRVSLIMDHIQEIRHKLAEKDKKHTMTTCIEAHFTDLLCDGCKHKFTKFSNYATIHNY